MFRAIFRGTAATLLALMTLVVSGQTLLGLDECYSRLEVSPRIPGCCAHEDVPTIEDVHRSCCRTPFVADESPSSTTASTPDVAGAELAVAHAAIGPLRATLGDDPRGFRPVVERPPDRAPPTRTTVLLI